MDLDTLSQRFSRLWNLAKPPAMSRVEDAARIIRALGHPRRHALSRQHRRAVELMQLRHVPPLLLTNVSSIVDIGANVGDWSVAAARLFPRATIRAYEPNPKVFETLERRLAPFGNVRASQLAISSHEETVQLHAYAQSALGSLHRLSEHAANVHQVSTTPAQRFSVRARPLDAELKTGEPVDLLKLDVQGHEAAVIAGALQTLQRTQVLMMEVTFTQYYEGDSDFWKLHQLLTHETPLRLWDLADVRRSRQGQAMWTDAVYIHEAHLP